MTTAHQTLCFLFHSKFIHISRTASRQLLLIPGLPHVLDKEQAWGFLLICYLGKMGWALWHWQLLPHHNSTAEEKTKGPRIHFGVKRWVWCDRRNGTGGQMCILQNKKLSVNILAHRNFQKNISLFSRLQFTPKEGSHLVLKKKKKKIQRGRALSFAGYNTWASSHNLCNG